MRAAPAAARGERVGIYTYSDAGSGGVVSSTYTLRATRWASFRPGGTSEGNTADAAQHQGFATFGFHERTDVRHNDVLVVNGEAYQVQGIGDPRTFSGPTMIREVTALWVDKANLNLVTN